MNNSKIDLFPVSRTETVETAHASVTMNFDSYSSNVSISDGTNTLNIRIDQDKMMRAFIYSLGKVIGESVETVNIQAPELSIRVEPKN